MLLRVSRVPHLVLAGALTLAIAAVAPAPTARAADWNQEQVAAAAADFAKAVKGIRKELRQEGSPSIASMQSRAHFRLKDNLRLIESEAKQLSRQLADGKGHDETLPIYARLRGMIRDAREDAEKMYKTSQLMERIEKARAELQKLEDYYQLEPLPEPMKK